MTETERLLWNLVSGIRAMAEADQQRSQAGAVARDRAQQQTEDAVKELAAALDAKHKK